MSESKSLKKFDSSHLKKICVVLFLVGIVLSALALQIEGSNFWQAFLINYFLFASLSIGGLFFVATQHATNAYWSVSVRRIPEAFTSFIPMAGLLGIIFMAGAYFHFGAYNVYHWAHPDLVQADKLLIHKSGYLNSQSIIIRTFVGFLLLCVFSRILVGNSLKQDYSGDARLTIKNAKFSAFFLVFYAIYYSMFSYDYMMSVEAHWFSTMFPVYTFASMFYTTMALIAIIAVYLKSKDYFGHYVNAEHIHDVSKLMFAFCVFWAYIAFSQFMLIWYAAIPEETFFYMKRWEGSWKIISLSLLVLKFIFPFLFLLSRHFKRNYKIMIPVCCLVLLTTLMDWYWVVYPTDSKVLTFGIGEIGAFFLISSLFAYMVLRFLGKHSLVPVKDPRIHECLEHHIAP